MSGGRLISDKMAREIEDQAFRLSYYAIFARDNWTPPPPPTFTQRIKARWRDYRARIVLAWAVLQDRHDCDRWD